VEFKEQSPSGLQDEHIQQVAGQGTRIRWVFRLAGESHFWRSNFLWAKVLISKRVQRVYQS